MDKVKGLCGSWRILGRALQPIHSTPAYGLANIAVGTHSRAAVTLGIHPRILGIPVQARWMSADASGSIFPVNQASESGSGSQLGSSTIVRLSDLPQELIDRYVRKLGRWRTTLKKPVYSMPYLEASHEEIDALPLEEVQKAIKAYGGLLKVPVKGWQRSSKQSNRLQNKEQYEKQKARFPGILRERLKRLTSITNKQCVIRGLVVSDRMNRSVVVVARIKKLNRKLKTWYIVHRRYQAHDEFDLCKQGDEVTIKMCRKMSPRKAYVVIENYGNPNIPDDNRKQRLKELVDGIQLSERQKDFGWKFDDEYLYRISRRLKTKKR